MSFDKFLRQDGLLRGVVLGVLVIPAVFWLVDSLGSLLAALLGRDNLFHPPLTQLYTLAVAIILCRLLIVNGGRELTGKGMLLLTLLAAFGYFIYSIRFRHAF